MKLVLFRQYCSYHTFIGCYRNDVMRSYMHEKHDLCSSPLWYQHFTDSCMCEKPLTRVGCNMRQNKWKLCILTILCTCMMLFMHYVPNYSKSNFSLQSVTSSDFRSNRDLVWTEFENICMFAFFVILVSLICKISEVS